MCVVSFTVKEQRMVRNPLVFSPLCLLGLTKVFPTVNNIEFSSYYESVINLIGVLNNCFLTV